MTDLEERLARLERKAQKPSAIAYTARTIVKVIGWIVLVPFMLIAALASLIASLGWLLIITGHLSILSYIIWIIIAPVAGAIAAVGMMLAQVGHWADDETA